MADSAAERGRIAERRIQELAAQLRDLTSGGHSSAESVEAARAHAKESLQRSVDAHRAAARRHLQAASVHEEAASVHERAAAEGIGDVEEHARAAARHRAAADADRRAALQDDADADAEE
ncbi:MAG: hypothetical protein CK429_14595 [Mycobacterium sp.]|jgi:hypothetical protein|uniref:Uncharacterized protein n=1 Tax=Mycobacterium gordonae TaxID=1778 RepID=A0A1A6BA60_MYCGO|nr:MULTISPECIES: hypothetical protein [Mycobacterium]MBI2703431.1 hypothetical protein [Mycobacterium sp.]MBX9982345.1 hypothetical protein [Mycobacterium gordonae]OBR99209.1 hypothetical protein A9W98_31265 [Mycobacterium gordonae]PJE12914.1 MAG: hypothetical protein CK429_14595 [Mycobacterium sp.]PJE16507.1 MAG: hypothetical protein CK428_02845 [Mycobacterium sp.]